MKPKLAKNKATNSNSTITQQDDYIYTLQDLQYPHWNDPQAAKMAPYIRTFGQDRPNFVFYQPPVSDDEQVVDQHVIDPVAQTTPVETPIDQVVKNTKTYQNQSESEPTIEYQDLVQSVENYWQQDRADQIPTVETKTVKPNSTTAMIISPAVNEVIFAQHQLVKTKIVTNDVYEQRSSFLDWLVAGWVAFLFTIAVLIGLTFVVFNYQNDTKWISEPNFQAAVGILGALAAAMFLIVLITQFVLLSKIIKYPKQPNWITLGLKRQNHYAFFACLPIIAMLTNISYYHQLKKLINAQKSQQIRSAQVVVNG